MALEASVLLRDDTARSIENEEKHSPANAFNSDENRYALARSYPSKKVWITATAVV